MGSLFTANQCQMLMITRINRDVRKQFDARVAVTCARAGVSVCVEVVCAAIMGRKSMTQFPHRHLLHIVSVAHADDGEQDSSRLCTQWLV